MVISHRVSLVRELRRRFNSFPNHLPIAHYKEVQKNGGLATFSGNLAICVNSIVHLDPENYRGADIYIDEITQLLAAIDTDIFNLIRNQVLRKLSTLLLNARSVVVSDKDLELWHLPVLMAWMGIEPSEALLIHNNYKRDGGVIYKHLDKNPTVATLFEKVRAGRKVFVAYDNREGCKTLAKLLGQHDVFLLTGETDEQEKFEFMDDVNKAIQDYQVLFVTSAMFTGVDINIDYFDDVFVLAEGATDKIPATDFVQALHRVRHPKGEIHTWVKEKNMKLLTDVEDVERRYLAGHLPWRTMREKEWLGVIEAYTDYYVDAIRSRNLSVNALSDNFYRLLENDGYVIEEVEDVHQRLAQTVEELEQEIANGEMEKEEALQIIRETARVVHFAGQPTNEIQTAYAKAPEWAKEIATAYHRLNGNSLEDFDLIVQHVNPDNFRKQIENHELRVQSIEEARRKDESFNYRAANVNNQGFEQRAELLHDLDRSLGGLTGREFTKEDAPQVLKVLRRHKDTLKYHYDQEVPKSEGMALKSLGALVRKTGLPWELVRQVRIDGEPMRFYGSNAEMEAALTRVVERRSRTEKSENKEEVALAAD